MIMVHGDDFMAIGTDDDLKTTKTVLGNKYKLKVETLGSGKGDRQEVSILSKTIRSTKEGVGFEADPRHAELVIKELGLQEAKEGKTPGSKDTNKKNSEDKKIRDSSESNMIILNVKVRPMMIQQGNY